MVRPVSALRYYIYNYALYNKTKNIEVNTNKFNQQSYKHLIDRSEIKTITINQQSIHPTEPNNMSYNPYLSN